MSLRRVGRNWKNEELMLEQDIIKQLEASERKEEGTGSVAEIGNQRPRFLSS